MSETQKISEDEIKEFGGISLAISHIEGELDNFIGTETYHRFSNLHKHVLTDGALYLARRLGAFWLMDVIASHQMNPRVKYESFQVWTIRRIGSGCIITATDGNDNMISSQQVEYTDFLFGEYSLFAQYTDYGDGPFLVIMLKSEY